VFFEILFLFFYFCDKVLAFFKFNIIKVIITN